MKQNRSLGEGIREGYENLGQQIILLAARDYKAAMKRVKLDPNDCIAKRQIREIEEFVHGRLFAAITEMDPDEFLAFMKE